MPNASKPKGSIVKAPAHTDPVTMPIETQKRRQDHIEELRCLALVRPEVWLGYAETVCLHPGRGSPGGKPHAPFQERVQYRQVALFTQAMREFEQWHGIDLSIAADIARDAFCALNGVELRQMATYLRAGACNLFRRNA